MASDDDYVRAELFEIQQQNAENIISPSPRHYGSVQRGGESSRVMSYVSQISDSNEFNGAEPFDQANTEARLASVIWAFIQNYDHDGLEKHL